MSIIDNFGQLAFLCLVRFTGKRRLYLIVTFGVFCSTLAISCFGFIYLPSGYNSFDENDASFHLENPNLAYVPMFLLFTWTFFSFCGFLVSYLLIVTS